MNAWQYAPPMHTDGTPTKVASLVAGSTSKWTPFPDSSYQKNIITCLSMRIDQQDRLWLLDFAQHGMMGAPKLVAFQLDESRGTHALSHEYTFPSSVAGLGSMLNDFQASCRANLYAPYVCARMLYVRMPPDCISHAYEYI